VFPEHLHDKLSTAAEPDARFDQIADFEETWIKSPVRRPTIGWALGPSAPERCSSALLQRTRDLAEKHDLPIFTHFYESKGMALQARMAYPQHGGSLVRALHAEGLLGPRMNLAHSVWLLDDEIELLAETGTRCVLNPLSNLKLKSGIPPVRRLQEAGVRFGLGCDNCSCSDAQNMFEAMKFAAMVTAIADHEPGPPQAASMLEAATAGGASCIGRGHDLGAIAPGMRADMVLLDLEDPSFLPLNSATRQLVYTEAGRGVRMVIVEGRIVVEDGRATMIDEAELARRVEDLMPDFLADFARIRERVDGMAPYLREAHRRIWAEDVGIDRVFHEPGRAPRRAG
jgi:guanine deaminase